MNRTEGRRFIALVAIAIIPRVFFAWLWGPYQMDLQGLASKIGLLPQARIVVLVLSLLSIAFVVCAYFATRILYGQRNALLTGFIVAFMPWTIQVSSQGYLEPVVATFYLIAVAALIIGARRGRWLMAGMIVSVFLTLALILKPDVFLLLPILQTGRYDITHALLFAGAFALLFSVPAFFIWGPILRFKLDIESGILLVASLAPFLVAGPIAEAFRVTEGGSIRGDIIRYCLPFIAAAVLLTLWVVMLPLFVAAPRT